MSVADAAAEILLAGAAIYVSALALRGWRLERRAMRTAEGSERDGLLADAKARYAAASLQRPQVLVAVLLGASAKALLALLSLL